jgi:hypothetical protein
MTDSTAVSASVQAPQPRGRPGRQGRKRRKAPEPVRGEGRWIEKPAADWSRPARLEISTRTGTAVYEVSAVRQYGSNALVGFRLAKEGAEEVYHIDTTPTFGPTCDCPDAYYRDKFAETKAACRCKHVVCLGAALKQLRTAEKPALAA